MAIIISRQILDLICPNIYDLTMGIIRQPFRYRNNNTVFWIIGINLLIYVVMYYLGYQRLTVYLSMIPGLVLRGWIWSFATYMFVHDSGFSHILFNMLALFIFGIQIEKYIGSKEFCLFYFVTGILAGVLSFVVYCLTGRYGVRLMGASGAIFAVQFAYAVFFPQSIMYLWGILPLRAPVMVLGFTALEVFSMIFRRNDGVAHLTHLAGYGFAYLYFVVRFGINPWKRLRLK